MQTISIETLRQGLDATMDRIARGEEALLITRDDAPSVVVMSEAEYRSVEETAHLLSTPANARRLARSLEEERTGKLTARSLLE